MLRPLLLALLLCFPGISAAANRDTLGVILSGDQDPTRNFPSDRQKSSEQPSLTNAVTPVVANAIPNQTRSLEAGSFTIDLSGVFEDTDGNDLTFSAISNNTDVATATTEDNMLIVTPLSLGSCRIRATATDDDNDRANDAFTLTIISNEPPQLTPEANLRDVVLFSEGSPLVLDLSTIFLDPEGDDLEYRAMSSEEQIAQIDLMDETVTIRPEEIGEAQITLSAIDEFGSTTEEQFRVEVILAYPSSLSAAVFVPFEDYRDQGNYRMIALPGDQSALVSTTVNGQHGQDWVAYAPDPEDNGAIIPYEESDKFTLRPGNGMWFLSKSDWVLAFRTIPTVPLSDQGTFEIPLHPGWNIISNPFDIDLSWNVIAEYNEVSQGIWRWRDGYQLLDTLHAAANIPEAYYFNNFENKTSLHLPYVFGSDTSSKKAAQSKNGDRLIVSAQDQATSKSSHVYVSWHEEASEGQDKFDQLAPPAHFSDLNLSLTPSHHDFENAPLALEARPTNHQLYQFDLALHAQAGDQILFDIQLPEGLSQDDVTLVNRLDMQRYSMISLQSYPIRVDRESTPFSMFVGPHQDIEEAISSLTPQLVSLKQNFPNPFNPTTTIEYTIPESQHVNLSIFDMMGRHIITLQDAEQTAGLHSVQWNGQDQQQRPVANGVYFYRLQTALWSKSLKMTLIR